MDRLTKSERFPVRITYNMHKYAEIYVEKIVGMLKVPSGNVSDRDPKLISHLWKAFNVALRMSRD